LHAVEKGSLKPSTIDRSIEIPELDDHTRKPLPLMILQDMIRDARRCCRKIEEVLAKLSDPGKWLSFFGGVSPVLSDLEKRFADVRVLERRDWFVSIQRQLTEFAETADILGRDVKHFTRLREVFADLRAFVSYLGSQGRFTPMSLYRLLVDTAVFLKRQATDIANPTIIARNAILRASVIKLANSILIPDLTAKTLTGLGGLCLELQKETDSQQASVLLQVAEWMTRTTIEIRCPAAVQLDEMAHNLRLLARLIPADGIWVDRLRDEAQQLNNLSDDEQRHS
jgi:hypothetical protein